MTTEPKKQNKYKWLYFGVIWGALMVLIMGVFEPMYYDTPITADTLRHDMFVWVSGGIVLGLVMHVITSRRKKAD